MRFDRMLVSARYSLFFYLPCFTPKRRHLSNPTVSAVYAKQCAACHDSGAARTPTKTALQDLEAETIVHALESGVMRVIGQWNLNGPERIAVAEYLSGKTYDANWLNNQVASCESPIAASDKPFDFAALERLGRRPR